MGIFTNLEVHLEPETTLFQPEVDVIQAVIEQALANLKHPVKQGTFILDGQVMGKREGAYNIMRFNLQDGRLMLLGQNSDKMAEEAINYILHYPRKGQQYDICPEYYWSTFGLLPSGFYYDECEQLVAMVVNASFGRFVASYYGGETASWFYRDSRFVLAALAETLAQLCKEDKVLQRSVGELMLKEPDAAILVKRMFDTCTHPALKAWRDWHESATKAGELTLFFE